MKRQPDLSDLQVLDIMRKLVAGTHPRVLAMAYNRNIETIRRIARGDSHQHLRSRVPGFAELAGPVQVITPQEASDRGLANVLPELSERAKEEAEAQAQAIMNGTWGKGGPKAPVMEVSKETFDLAQELLGHAPTGARVAETPPEAYPTEGGDEPTLPPQQRTKDQKQ